MPGCSQKIVRKVYALATGYCMKCKKKVTIINPMEQTLKKGRKALAGKCPTCGTKVMTFIKSKP